MIRRPSALRSLLALVITLSVSSCLPRGETHTLDQVLGDAQIRYQSQSRELTNAEVAKAIGEIETKIQEMLAGGDRFDYRAAGTQVSDQLYAVAPHAGYTSRPALGELASQYRNLPAGATHGAAARVKLLVARTYSLLSSELEGARFGL